MMVTSCFLDSDDDLTIVKGKVTNKIDGINLSGIPIELLDCHGSYFNAPNCDSIKVVYTDSEGNYELSFRTERKHHYKIRVGENINYEEIIIEGKTNRIDFQLMKYTTLKVILKTSKGNKSYLQIAFVRDRCAGGLLEWDGGILLLDTVRAHQSIDTVRYLSVSPSCDYRFIKSLCSRRGGDLEYEYPDCTDFETIGTIYVDHSDTTEIELN
jgi:hypothetical protein